MVWTPRCRNCTNAAQKSALEVQLLSRNLSPKKHIALRAGSCSFLQYSGACRVEKAILGHTTTVNLVRVDSPPTAPFPKDKHPLQVNQITSQQSFLSI